MADSIKTLLEQRNVAYKAMVELRETAKGEERDFTGEEQAQWDASNADYDALTEKIDAAKQSRDAWQERDERLAGQVPSTKGTLTE